MIDHFKQQKHKVRGSMKKSNLTEINFDLEASIKIK
jgi:hypothetical protein